MRATTFLISLFFITNLFAANPMVMMETNLGKIKIELFEDKAPISTKNFLSYVDKKFYDGLIFHRVIGNFMIQGGGFDKKMQRRITQPSIKNEATNNISNKRGTLAMARTSAVDSATSQFFINVVDNGFLDHRSTDPAGYGYAVFGRVVEGMDVVDKIRSVPTGEKNGMKDVPKETVEIISVTLTKSK